MKRVFIDTNILVDLICKRNPFVEEAEKIFSMGIINRISIGISALSYINTVYISKKYQFNQKDVIESLKTITSFTTITGLDETIIIQAMTCNWPDFEDAVQYHSSQSFIADAIITRNKKDFSHSNIPVYTPTEFLQMPYYWMENSSNTVLNEPEFQYGKKNND